MRKDDLLQKIRVNKDSGFKYRKRRHPEWTENYMLYRDRVITNRLTQRQSVNIPLMKYALNTLRKDIDDAPMLYFRSKDNDAQKEVFFNESFKYYMRCAKSTIKDIHDKNNGMLFGRTFKKLNIVDGKFDFEIIDAQDMNVQRYTDPARLDSARCLIHEHIYRAVAELSKNPILDQKEVKRIKEYFASEEGLLKSTQNMEDMVDRQERMEEMGVEDMNDPILGEMYVELNEVYLYQPIIENGEEVGERLHLIIMAEDNYILLDKPLSEVLGQTRDNYWDTHFPFVSWGVDPDHTDFWCDGIADVLRMPNKIVNTWFSQEVENRTLRSFGMNFYDSSNKSYTPQTFQPTPFGFYPTPGDPNKVIKPVFAQELRSNLDGINFLLSVAEKASAATTANQGVTEKRDVTLGEIKMAVSNAQDRVRSLAVFYNDSWLEFGEKYVKLLEGAWEMLDDIEVTKKGRMTDKLYTRIVSPKDWLTFSSYDVEIKTVVDKTQEDVEQLQKLQAAAQFFNGNSAFDEIKQKKAAEFAGLDAEQIERVMDVEKQNKEAQQQVIDAAQGAAGGAGGGEPMPQGGQPPMPPNGGMPNLMN